MDITPLPREEMRRRASDSMEMQGTFLRLAPSDEFGSREGLR
jgi:hypothetical protein